MKTRYLLFAILLLVLSGRAKADNCGVLTTALKHDNQTMNEGNQFIASETWIYGVNCNDSNKGTVVSTFDASITATGSGGIRSNSFSNQFTSCNPIFSGAIVTNPTTQTSSTMTLVAQNNSFSPASGCVGLAIQKNTSFCASISCTKIAFNPPPGCPACSPPPGQPPGFSPATCCSPIVISTGEGFKFTDAPHGVMFDISGTGTPIQLAWTQKDSGDGFLALPEKDGLIHSGKDLFGSATAQPPIDHPNGFNALAVYDTSARGGNGDGVIDSSDAIFSSLRIWIDANHDGISQPSELFTLASLGIQSFNLKYEEKYRVDQFGNWLRYRARVEAGDEVGRTAWDVFFVTLDPVAGAKCAPKVPTGGK